VEFDFARAAGFVYGLVERHGAERAVGEHDGTGIEPAVEGVAAVNERSDREWEMRGVNPKIEIGLMAQGERRAEFREKRHAFQSEITSARRCERFVDNPKISKELGGARAVGVGARLEFKEEAGRKQIFDVKAAQALEEIGGDSVVIAPGEETPELCGAEGVKARERGKIRRVAERRENGELGVFVGGHGDLGAVRKSLAFCGGSERGRTNKLRGGDAGVTEASLARRRPTGRAGTCP